MTTFFNILNGIYFLIWGLLFLFFSGLLLLMPKEQVNAGTGMITVVLAMYIIGAAVLVAISVGLFLRKDWARWGAITMAAFALFGGLSAGVSSIMMRDIIMTSEQQTDILPAMMVFLGIFFGIIPTGMIVYYCLRPVRIMFAGDPTVASEAEEKIPLGIRLLIMYFASSILGLVSLWFTPAYEAPVFFFWIWLAGDALKFFSAGMAVLHVYLAYGFYRMQKLSRTICLVLYGYYVLSTVYGIVALSEPVMNRMYSFMAEGIPFLTVGTARVFYGVSLVFLVPVWLYVYRKKEYFVN